MSSRLQALVAQAVPAGAPPRLAVVGPGGMGKSELLDAIAAASRATGRPVFWCRGRRQEAGIVFAGLEDVLATTDPAWPTPGKALSERAARRTILDLMAAGGDGAGPAGTLLIDDAQWLDPRSLRVLVAVAERAAARNLGLVVAHRPAAGHDGLAALDAALSRREPVLWLVPLSEDDVADRVGAVLGTHPEPAVVEALMSRTEGVPLYVDRLLAAWRAAGVIEDGRLGRDPGEAPAVAARIVGAEIDQLPPAARIVLGACTVGVPVDDELAGALFGLDPAALAQAVKCLAGAGLLSPVRRAVLPLVVEAVEALTPLLVAQELHARLATVLTDRGVPPSRVAEHLVAGRRHGPGVADLLVRAGDEVLADSPEQAREWYEEAVAAGAAAAPLAARRAEAAALAGATDEALCLADGVVGHPEAPDRFRALAVLAGTLAHRGLWGRAADLYAEVAGGGERGSAGNDDAVRAALLAAVAYVASGRAEQAWSSFRRAEDAPGRLPVLHLTATGLLARGALASLGQAAEHGEALSCLVEAAELLDAGRRRHVLPDTPHALGAVLATAAGDYPAAEHLLIRAEATEAGGVGFATRHRLLHGWVGLRTGRWALAQAVLDELGGPAGAACRRDALWAFALDAGLARRTGDIPRLNAAWAGAKADVLRHPTDLFSVEALGELAVTAARLGEWRVVEPRLEEIDGVVAALGDPPVWALPLRWSGLLAAVMQEDAGAARMAAKALSEVVPVASRLGALADAGQVWAAVIAGTVEGTQVQAAARGLRELGFTWEAVQLAGAGAGRSPQARALLELARDLKATLPTVERGTLTHSGPLSEREREVASLVLAGLTHKQIGARLFISPKTVEHHVAKIRQRLGATTRAQLLAGLRRDLEPA